MKASNTQIFVYGTLRDSGVRDAVLGHPVQRLTKAFISDHAARLVKNETWPMLKPMAGATAEGLILHDLDDADLAALDAFEGSSYQRVSTLVFTDSGVQEKVWLYQETAGYEDGGPFVLEDWRRQHRAGFISRFMQDRGFPAPDL